MTIFRIIPATCLAILLSPLAAHAVTEPRPIQIDHRVRTAVYQPDNVYRYTGHYRYQSSIEFGKDESIVTISMGDSTAWMMNPSGNRLFLKPIEQDATTNMTLITNKRIYLFELHAKDTDDINDPSMVFIMRFIYPDETNSEIVTSLKDNVPELDLKEHPEKYNFNYTIAGPDETAPIRIFDDGEFTYFEFRDKNAEMPAFFWVDKDGNESLVNYRTRGPYIVVERVASKYTLRHGSNVVCVFNEARLEKSK
jgi:type IV secretion system protein VirB9